jgi:hypothetical protein
MANPFQVNPPNVLQALMLGAEGFDRSRKMQREGQQDQARQFAADALLNGGDSRSALARLLQGGDIAGANAVANFGNQASDQEYKQGMLKVAQQNASRQEVPPQLKILEAAGIPAASPEGRKALFPRTDTPISATDKKAIFEAEDANVPLQSTLETLRRAKELAPKAFSGYTAGVRGTIGANLPSIAGAVGIDPKSAEATVELNQLLSGEAIKNMAETLKGATTDSEMNRFTSILADPNAPPQLKIRTIERMETLAVRKAQINDARIKQLRGGDYFKEGGGAASQPRGAIPGGSQVVDQARDAIARGADRNAVIQRLRQNGIDPAGL